MKLHPAKLAAAAFVVGLLGAGGMSLAGAQTDPTTTEPPAATAPADPSTATPPADDPSCPRHKGGQDAPSDSTTDSTDTAPSASSTSDV